MCEYRLFDLRWLFLLEFFIVLGVPFVIARASSDALISISSCSLPDAGTESLTKRGESRYMI